MNEKAIKVAYELFVADGYTKSIEDFKNLMRDNPKGREVAYNLFVNDGYNKSINDFAILMGATESLGETPQPDVKKKGMVSPSEDGSLVSSETEVVEGAVLEDDINKKVDWNAMAERESAIINEEQKKKSSSGFVSEQAIFGEGGSKADTEVKDPFATTGEMTEKDFFTGTFGDVLRKIDQFSPINVGDFIDDQARAIASGFKQGELAENASDLLLRGANASDEDIESYLEALRESQKYGASDEFMEFQKIYQKNGEGFLGFVLGIAQTSQSVIPEILLNSFASMLANKDSRYAFEATVLGGAGIGGASGSAGGPVGIAAGASVGAVGSLPYAFAAAGTALEVGATFSELLLEEAGDRELTKEVITEILNDEEAYKRIRNKAIARGLTIGVIDAITGKMGSKFTTGILTKGGTQSVKQATKKDVLKSIIGSSLIEGAGGSIGEATARALIGQDMDIAEIGLEGIAEVPGSAVSFAQTALSSPTYKVNGEFVDREVIDDLISTMTLDEIAQGNIEISNDYSGMEFKLQERIKKLKTEADIILANPNINKPTLDKIAELQLELDKLKGNDTEVAKEKSASIRAEIKNLQENQLEDTVDETTKTSYESLSAEDKMDLRTKALDELENEGVESPTNEDIDKKAVSILDKELQLLGQKSQKKKQSFAEGLGETTDLGDVMEGGVQVNMDGTKVIITEDKDGVTIESIETEEGKKGQGKAEAAVKQITEKADKDGVDVKLKLVPKDNTVDAKRLQALYERNGFKMQEDGVTMVRSIGFDNVSDNLFINRKDSSPILGLIPQKTRSFAMTAARLASKTLSKIAPEVKIVLHESQNEYSKYAGGDSSGEYNPLTNTIHINLSNAKRSTVAHEVFHAVLLNKLKNNDALAKKISDDMVRSVQRRLPKNNKLRLAVEEHAAKYQGDQAQLQTEEQIAELIGLLSSVEGGYAQLDSDMKSVIKRFFLNLAKKLNIPLPKNWGSDQDVVDLINTLARKTRTGEAITEADVKLLDVKEEEGGEFLENPASALREDKVGNFEITYTEDDKIAQYVKDGRITEPKDILDIFKDLNTSSVEVLVHSPDDMLAGEIKYKGKTIFEGSGGVFFVTKFGEVWASTEDAANQIVKGLNKQVEEQGKGFMLLTKGSDQKLMSSPTGVDGAIKVIGKMLEAKIFSLSQFRTAVSEAVYEEQNRLTVKAKKDGKKAPKFKPFSLKKSAEGMMSDITRLFSDESSGTFETRGNIVKGIGNALVRGKLTPEQQSKVAKFLGGDTARRVGVASTKSKKTGDLLSQGLSDLIALTLAEKLTKGLNTGDVYAVIEVNQKVKPEKSTHPSYDTSIVTLNSKPPTLHLLKNRQPGKEVLAPTFGKDKNNPYSVGQVPTMTGQINLEKKVEPKVTDNTTPATRQQIIGENAELTYQQEYTLTIAKDIQRAKTITAKEIEKGGLKNIPMQAVYLKNKTPKEIKYMTGWELGADNKWRYEVPDGKVLGEKIKKSGKYKLKDFYDAPDLYKAYPQLKNIPVELNLMDGGRDSGWYSPTENDIEINIKNENKYTIPSLLVHELQHAIQFIEFFGVGGNERVAWQAYLENRTEADIKKEEDLNKEIETLEKYRDIFEAFELGEYDDFLDGLTFEELFSLDFLKKSEFVNNELGDEGIKDVIKYLNNNPSFKEDMLNQFNEYEDFDFESMYAWNELLQKNKEKRSKLYSPFGMYERLAGEVEARNAETRMLMSEDKRRRTTLEETEDTPREDQLILPSEKFLEFVTRQQKGIKDARENGEVIETDSELVFFKGMQPKMKNGKPFSVHTIDKGRFVALDKNIALDYKGNKPLKQFKVPKGTTVQVVNVPSDSITKYRKAEEKAINESDAQIVKLITIDARGRSEQYVIKDPALLKTATDVKEVSAKTQEKQTSRARQQKGLINFTEKDAVKYSKIGINDARTIQAMENIGLSGVKFTDEGVNKKIKESLNELYSKADSYLLNEDSDEITRLMNFEIEAAINDGQPERVINQLKSQVDNKGARDRFISQLKNTQEETLNQWVSYLKQSDYSDAFKYLMLDAVLTHNYDLKSLKYRKRTNKTSRNISPFDAGTLAMVYASDSKNLLKSYVEMQQENLDNIINASQVDKTSEGKWLKFDGGPNAENINETATALSQLVQDTYWCTKTNALGQLREGDFYVYVTGKSPRIAIRMEGDKVGEVRGNASSKQDLEPEMLPVAETFLKENIPNNSGKKWLDSIEFNKKAKEFIERAKKGIGEKEILEYADIVSEGKKYNTDYGENGFVEKAKSIFRDKNYYNEDILNRVAFNADEFDADKTEYLIGNIRFGSRDITTLGNLKVITGFADFKNSQIKSLGKLKSIGGDTDFGESQVTDLGQLQSIGGYASFTNSQVTNLGQLKSIGDTAYLNSSQVTDLGQLQSIGGNAYFNSSEVTDLGKLKSIGYGAYFNSSQVTNLGQLQSIGGAAYFGESQVTNLGQLKSIGDDADFNSSQVTDLGQLQSIGGNAYFKNSQIKSLGKLKSIGGDAYFGKSQVTDLGQLQSIGVDAIFTDSQIKSLGKLKSIGDYADFSESQVTDLGQLQSIGGFASFDKSQVDLRAEWNSRQNKAATRQSKFDAESFIKNARAQGISEAAIKIILRNRGIDETTINNALSKTKGKASGRVKIDESFAEGYNTMMKVIDGIIKKTKAKFAKEDTSPQTLFDSTLPYLQGSKVYENATDVQREKMVRDLRKKVGLKEKSSPSISRILGKVKDVKNILVSEKELLIKRIKDVREGATTTIKAIKLAQKEIIDGVKDLKKKGKITTTQLTNIISKLNRIDMLSESDVNEFFDYMAKVFNDAEYVEKLRNANNKRKNALKNIPKKIGVANSIAPSLVKIFSINPSLIPDAVFDKYIKLVNQFGERASVLKLSSIKVVERVASEILNQIEIETSKIPQLKEYLESFENKVIDSETGKLNYAETIRLMLNEEVINESDYEVMKKYKSEIIEKEQKEAKTDAEILKEKKEIIKRLKRRKELNVENLPSRFEVERARRFKELIKDSEILMRLSVNELKQIEKLVGNIRNGYFPSLANEMIIKLEGELNGNKLSKGINEGKLLPKERLRYNLRKLFGKGSKTILNQIKSTPLYYIDQVFGNFKESLIRNSLFDGLAKQIQKFESSFKKTSGKIEKAQLAVFKSFKNPNEAVMSSFKQMAYLIQLEYETNIGNPETKHQAKAYIEKTIQAIDDGASTYTDKDAETLSTILKDFTENGEISLDKIWNSFNSAEKNSIKTIQEVNADLGPIAQQTANIIRGEGITARNNYVHLNVINEKGSDPMANEAFIDGYTKSLKPSTRSKSLIKRQGVVSPLNFDVYASAIKGAKGTLLDFHMTNAIRTANATINSAERLLKGDDPRMSSENRDKFNAIKEAYDNVLRIEFTNAYFTTTFIEDALNWISKNGYRTMLAGVVRAAIEFKSNAAFALLSNPLALISGAKIGIGFINSDAAPEVMNNLNSTQTNRIYPNEDLSGRMIDTNLMNKKKGIKGGRIKNRYANKLTQIWNLTGDKYVNAVATLADNLISSPDKAVMRPVWFGAFQNEFKKITGSNPDFDKIAANDTEYMDANKEALQKATEHADENSIYTGSTTNPFYGILRGKSLPTDTTFTKAYNAFNNFMLTFLMYEYMTVRTGIVSAVGRGSLSKTKGAALVAASATRMIMYTMMISVMGEVMSNLVGGDDEEKEIKSLDKRLGQSIASTLLTASLGRSGNAFRSVINFLAEGANEEYLDMLRDGEYDVYKDGLAFQTIPKEKNRGTALADILLNSFAAYGPAVKTVDFMVRKATEPAKNTEEAQQRKKEELMYRLPLEVLGNTGFIPMYKDVRKVVLGSIYNGIGNETSDQKNLQKEVKKSFDSGFNNGFNKKGFDKKGFGD